MVRGDLLVLTALTPPPQAFQPIREEDFSISKSSNNTGVMSY